MLPLAVYEPFGARALEAHFDGLIFSASSVCACVCGCDVRNTCCLSILGAAPSFSIHRDSISTEMRRISLSSPCISCLSALPTALPEKITWLTTLYKLPFISNFACTNEKVFFVSLRYTSKQRSALSGGAFPQNFLSHPWQLEHVGCGVCTHTHHLTLSSSLMGAWVHTLVEQKQLQRGAVEGPARPAPSKCSCFSASASAGGKILI